MCWWRGKPTDKLKHRPPVEERKTSAVPLWFIFMRVGFRKIISSSQWSLSVKKNTNSWCVDCREVFAQRTTLQGLSIPTSESAAWKILSLSALFMLWLSFLASWTVTTSWYEWLKWVVQLLFHIHVKWNFLLFPGFLQRTDETLWTSLNTLLWISWHLTESQHYWKLCNCGGLRQA